MRNTEQDPGMVLAALASYHPNEQAKTDPRFQTNNTLNLAGLEPRVVEYGTPYGDARVPRLMPGVTLTQGAQQQIIRRPLKAGAVPGDPAFMLDYEMARQLQGRLGTSTPLSMAASEQRPQGNPRVAMDRGIQGSSIQQRGTNMSLSGRMAAAGRDPRKT